MMNSLPLGYDPSALPRELKRHYISATEKELAEMLSSLGKRELGDFFSHVPASVRMNEAPALPTELNYEDLQACLAEIASKNNRKASFLGHGLPQFSTAEIVPHVLGIRRLTTAYTPYQPERSQGTLATLWIYQCALAAISGFEAVNASFYDRSTALFEAIKCAQRLVRGSSVAVIAGTLYPNDREVLQTHAIGTDLELYFVAPDVKTGRLDPAQVKSVMERYQGRVAALCFPQINSFGNLELVDELTNLAEAQSAKSIAIVDPILLGNGNLKPPREFGNRGADMFVAEGQHLAIGPNFGGPGLGIFGIRYNEENKNDIRQTAGRFIGRCKDVNGRDAYSIVLSTREQHIRREKATSNICSNQAYIATVAGAALMERGAEGLTAQGKRARQTAQRVAKELLRFPGVELAFPATPFFNEFTLSLPKDCNDVIARASELGVHVGVNGNDQIPQRPGNFLVLACSDLQGEKEIAALVKVFTDFFGAPKNTPAPLPELNPRDLRNAELVLPKFALADLKDFYVRLGEQNVSPDENIYALGSCTMKYNPYINDWAAALPGFTDIHPEAPEADVQGALQIIYETQEYFKAITGLQGVTTQPVAGAQGELVGIKLFQGYHLAKGETARNIILIPRSAHGTNPATATMAGANVVLIDSIATGEIDIEHLKRLIAEHGPKITGVMITNPNTSGVFEAHFREVADLVHAAGGLVYMDGANMNAIAGWVDLGKLGVDAVHNNTHKTWTIPHGGGGPGDAFVAVSAKLVDFLPGTQVVKEGNRYRQVKPKFSIGSFHRHHGNFAHKVRCYTYLRALGRDGIRRMSGVAVLSANYLFENLREFPSLPAGAESTPRMHEFILTLSKETFAKIEAKGLKKSDIIPRVGKLFLDFGLHAPTVAFPEVYGLMIEPTESYTKAELDRFVGIVRAIGAIIEESPEVLLTVPHFTPIDKVDEVGANRDLLVSERLSEFPKVYPNRVASEELNSMDLAMIRERIVAAHRSAI